MEGNPNAQTVHGPDGRDDDATTQPRWEEVRPFTRRWFELFPDHLLLVYSNRGGWHGTRGADVQSLNDNIYCWNAPGTSLLGHPGEIDPHGRRQCTSTLGHVEQMVALSRPCRGPVSFAASSRRWSRTRYPTDQSVTVSGRELTLSTVPVSRTSSSSVGHSVPSGAFAGRMKLNPVVVQSVGVTGSMLAPMLTRVAP